MKMIKKYKDFWKKVEVTLFNMMHLLLTGASLGIPIHGFRSPVAEPMDE